MRAMSQRDTVFGHVHRRHVALAVRLDDGLLSVPRLAVILAAVDGQRSGRMVVFHEGQDVTGRLIYRGPTPREPLGDDDFLAPALAAIFAATNADVLAIVRFKDSLSPRLQPSDHDRSVEGHHAWRLYSLEILCNWKCGLPRKDS